jgi:hypothetical protein
MAGRHDPRTFDVAALDRVHQRDVEEVARADVAHGRESGAQRHLAVLHRAQRGIDRGLVHRAVDEVAFERAAEVHVAIEQSPARA